MTLQNIDQLLKNARKLTPAERLLLANRLIQDVHHEMPDKKPHRKWKNAAGLLSYPAPGMDAQVYISQARRADDDDDRASVIRDGE